MKHLKYIRVTACFLFILSSVCFSSVAWGAGSLGSLGSGKEYGEINTELSNEKLEEVSKRVSEGEFQDIDATESKKWNEAVKDLKYSKDLPEKINKITDESRSNGDKPESVVIKSWKNITDNSDMQVDNFPLVGLPTNLGHLKDPQTIDMQIDIDTPVKPGNDWLIEHNKSLIKIIRDKLANEPARLQKYMSSEAGLNLYQQIEQRVRYIEHLLNP